MLSAGDSQLTVEPGRILTGGKVCPDTAVRFTCVAINVRVLTWLRNVSEQIAQFTNQDMASTEPEMNGPFSIYLNSSDNDGQNNLNVTSTLVGPASGFQSGDRIACPDNNGDPLVLDFTSEFNLTLLSLVNNEMETSTRTGLFGTSTSLKCHPLINFVLHMSWSVRCDPALITTCSIAYESLSNLHVQLYS